jgi:hypothetical protein
LQPEAGGPRLAAMPARKLDDWLEAHGLDHHQPGLRY